MTSTRPRVAVGPLPSWDWETVEAGTDLSPRDHLIVWTTGRWLPARLQRRNLRTVDLNVYDWGAGPDGHVHHDDIPASRRPSRNVDSGRFPVERVARRRADRSR